MMRGIGMLIKDIKCINCGKIFDAVEYYNRYNKTEKQIRAGYRCLQCQLKRQQKYRNKRGNPNL